MLKGNSLRVGVGRVYFEFRPRRGAVGSADADALFHKSFSMLRSSSTSKRNDVIFVPVGTSDIVRHHA